MSAVAKEIRKPIHTSDAKDLIFEASKVFVESVAVTGTDLLICIYERPPVVVLGKDPLGRDIEWDMSETSRKNEDRYQGIVGLVVQVGPKVMDHAEFFQNSQPPKVGDWVMAPIRDCYSVLGGYHPNSRIYRIIEAKMIRLILQDPDIIL